jgi:hypothetical protein
MFRCLVATEYMIRWKYLLVIVDLEQFFNNRNVNVLSAANASGTLKMKLLVAIMMECCHFVENVEGITSLN